MEKTPHIAAKLITHLNFGEGQIAHNVVVDEPELLSSLDNFTKAIRVHNTADCVDGRKILSFADGIDDADIIKARVTHQLPGGLVLAVTKAASAADLAIIRDAKSFKDAYQIMFGFLTDLGYEDGGHVDCGASKKLLETVDSEVPQDLLLPTVQVIRPGQDNLVSLANANMASKRRRLATGFYDSWDNKWHEQFLYDHVPKNFATLQSDDTELRGHYEEGLYLIGKPGFGLAKNEFIDSSGSMVFCETTHSSLTIVNSVSTAVNSGELERRRFLFELDAYGPNVLNKLAAKGLAVFGS